MKIVRKSILTGNISTREIECTKEQLAAWAAGTVIQRAMPHLSSVDREFVMTGITPEEWAANLPEKE